MRNKGRTGSYKKVYFCFLFLCLIKIELLEKTKLVAILHS